MARIGSPAIPCWKGSCLAREAAKPTMTDKVIQSAVRAASSSVGRQLGNQLLRGILGGLMRR